MTTAIASDKRRQLLRDGFCLFEQILDPGFAERVRCPAAVGALAGLGFPAPEVAVGANRQQKGKSRHVKKVILVGDSIRMGYEPVAVRELKGWAEVIEMGGIQGGNTRNVLVHLDEWVISRDPDIVHLNAGLHDMARDPGPGLRTASRSTSTSANLERILRTLQRETRAALVFALTHPVDLGRQLAIAKGVNRTAEDPSPPTTPQPGRPPAGLGVAVNDLHAAVVEAGAAELLAEDGVHFTAAEARFSGAPPPPRCARWGYNLGCLHRGGGNMPVVHPLAATLGRPRGCRARHFLIARTSASVSRRDGRDSLADDFYVGLAHRLDRFLD